MEIAIKRWFTFIDQIKGESSSQPDLRKVAVVAVVDNPYAGRGYVEDLTPMIDASVQLGREIGQVAAELTRSHGVQGYGKAGLVGTNGEQEHANALLTTRFANPVRDAIGGAKAWISSVTKRASPGETIDIPIAHKDAVYVRSHYDAMTLKLPDCPGPDEIALIMVFTNRGRINARVGGLKHEEIKGLDGLM